MVVQGRAGRGVFIIALACAVGVIVPPGAIARQKTPAAPAAGPLAGPAPSGVELGALSAPRSPDSTRDGAAGGRPASLPVTAGAQLLRLVARHADLTPGERALAETRDGSYLDPTNWAVSIYKSRHQLIVYYRSQLFRVYEAVFGRNLEAGTKQWEGDLRTPEGVYWIVKKLPSRRFTRFLGLNYPNIVDQRRYQGLVQAGEVPLRDGRLPAVGGAIGIHGTDEPRFNRWNINWTAGCISVDDQAIIELDRILPVGTLVIIKP